MLDLCGDVAVVVWLLGSATGEPDAIAAIHGPRLERLLEKLVDSPVRGFAYEAAGSVDRAAPGRGPGDRRAGGGDLAHPGGPAGGGREQPRWAGRSAEAVAGLLAG